MKLFSGRKILILSSPGFVFSTESLTSLAFLMAVQLVVAQLSLLIRNAFVISFGIPARPPEVRLGGNSLPYILQLSRLVLCSHVKFGAYLRSKIKLEIQWIPRTENEKADFISRLIHVDDWQLIESFFATLEEAWGPHSVDVTTPK